MTAKVELNHTIVHARDPLVSARFLSEIMGLPPPETLFHFQVVRTTNGVSLDFIGTDEEIQPQHYAFLVSDREWDEIFGRIRERGMKYWADPARREEGKTNTHFGGRGVYFLDPSGHFLEIITRPYAMP